MRRIRLLFLIRMATLAMKPLEKHERDELFKEWDKLWRRYEEVGWSKLSRPEQVFYAVWHLESEVNHGGFQYYYFYSGGDQALDAPAALETVGAQKLKVILLKANAVFPDSKPSHDINKRQAYLDDKLGDRQHSVWASLDELVFKHPDPTEELLWAYYLKHRLDFR